MKKYEGYNEIKKKKTEEREKIEQANKNKLNYRQKAKSAMILDVPGKIDE